VSSFAIKNFEITLNLYVGRTSEEKTTRKSPQITEEKNRGTERKTD